MDELDTGLVRAFNRIVKKFEKGDSGPWTVSTREVSEPVELAHMLNIWYKTTLFSTSATYEVRDGNVTAIGEFALYYGSPE